MLGSFKAHDEVGACPVGTPPAVEGATAVTVAVMVKFCPYTVLSAEEVRLMAVSACGSQRQSRRVTRSPSLHTLQAAATGNAHCSDQRPQQSGQLVAQLEQTASLDGDMMSKRDKGVRLHLGRSHMHCKHVGADMRCRIIEELAPGLQFAPCCSNRYCKGCWRPG